MSPANQRQELVSVSVSGEVAAGQPCRSLAGAPRQAQVLRFIQMGLGSPTVKEIRLHLGVSSLATVHKHLRALQRKRLVDWTPSAQRTLRAVSPENQYQSAAQSLRDATKKARRGTL